MNPTDPTVGEKRKQTKKSMKGHKKRKDDKSSRTFGLTNDNYTLLTDAMEKLANKILKKIDERQTELTSSITYLLQAFCKAVKEVRVAVDYRPQLSVSREVESSLEGRPSDVSIPILPINK